MMILITISYGANMTVVWVCRGWGLTVRGHTLVGFDLKDLYFLH